MPKIYIASFNRASDGAISKLKQKMINNELYTNDYKNADYILVCGDRRETFDFALERFRENKKIIHLWAGEISQGTHDEVYRHAITMMSCLQLCTNANAMFRAMHLLKSINMVPNAYIIGNVMYDNLNIDESEVPEISYDLVLYNPPTLLSQEEINKELRNIVEIIGNNKYIWIEPNGDMNNDVIKPYVNESNLQREKFLGLLKHCNRFITNSSCQYYEAPYVMINKDNIISIGVRNFDRESKRADMSIPNASDNIINIFKELRNGKIQ